MLDPCQLYQPLALDDLEQTFSWAEIVSAINKSPNNKSPGPDGFTNEFYKAYKHLIKEDLMRFFSEFYNLQANLAGVNTASIVLLPKKESPIEIKDFKPISLVHSLPKLSTKVLANRLQKRIPEMVHPLQSGFLAGRCIVENFALAAELVQFAHKRKLPMIVLKLDFRKAFDSVSWEGLLAILAARGFGQRWISWIKELLHSSSSRVLVNGSMGDPIQSRSGLRQGDSLSPYLFILVADLLQRLCCAEHEQGNLTHPLNVDSFLPVLQYADDMWRPA